MVKRSLACSLFFSNRLWGSSKIRAGGSSCLALRRLLLVLSWKQIFSQSSSQPGNLNTRTSLRGSGRLSGFRRQGDARRLSDGWDGWHAEKIFIMVSSLARLIPREVYLSLIIVRGENPSLSGAR